MSASEDLALSAGRPAEGYALRPATEADLAGLLALQGECAGAPLWSAPVWSDLLREPGRGRMAWVMERAAKVVGFAVVGMSAGTAELESVAVGGAHRSAGLGRALCRRGLDWARSTGATSMQLEVRESNEAALALYRSLGFVEQGRRRKYYAHPVEDAILMSLDLN